MEKSLIIFKNLWMSQNSQKLIHTMRKIAKYNIPSKLFFNKKFKYHFRKIVTTHLTTLRIHSLQQRNLNDILSHHHIHLVSQTNIWDFKCELAVCGPQFCPRDRHGLHPEIRPGTEDDRPLPLQIIDASWLRENRLFHPISDPRMLWIESQEQDDLQWNRRRTEIRRFHKTPSGSAQRYETLQRTKLRMGLQKRPKQQDGLRPVSDVPSRPKPDAREILHPPHSFPNKKGISQTLLRRVVRDPQRPACKNDRERFFNIR